MTVEIIFRSRAKAFLGALVFSLVTTASAQDFAQEPLFIGSAVDPNLLFILDDSGSMLFEHMPDGLDSDYDVDRVCTGNWLNRTCTRTGEDAESQWYYSSQVNKVYYDPSIDYEPPVCDDSISGCVNGRFPDSSYGSAWIDGYSGGASRDLSNNFVHRPYGYWTGSNASLNFTAGGFYYSYSPGANDLDDCNVNPKQNKCYTYVSLNSASSEEQENFANWYSYYRSREMSAKAGIGNIFGDPELATSFRLGWGEINRGENSVDGANVRAVRNGVRPFESVRSDFLDWLYSGSATGSTPLRQALEGAGEYFENSDRPWLDDPGSSESTSNPARECRISATMLMTDGYYGGGDPAWSTRGAASTDGPVHTNSAGDSGQYKAEDPFSDGSTTSRTLADVAAYYWKRDLRTDIDNFVPTIDPVIDEDGTGMRETVGNPAFWQHMMTYGIGLGVEGSVSGDEAVSAVHEGTEIDWWGGTGDENKINDLLRASIIGRGDFFSASDPATFSSELASMLEGFVGDTSSATGVSFDMTEVTSGDSAWAFTAQFQPANWSGDVVARPVGTDDGLTVEAGRERSAASQLDRDDLSHEDRVILTYDGVKGVPFLENYLTDRQEADLALAGDLGDVVSYIRGERSNEVPSGSFRARGSRLGDIVHSTPAYVGAPASNWPRTGIYDGYSDYVSDNEDRSPVIYAGSNDGMLHAFNAEEVTGNNGEREINFSELFAYIPDFLYSDQQNQGLHYLADPDYNHKFYVDLPLRSADVEISGRSGVGSGTTAKDWRTILIGGSRTGGKGIFALDVTDPSLFSEDNAGKLALWEFTDENLGYLKDAPIISLAEWGKDDLRWTAFFGNGYGQDATGLFMLDINGLVTDDPDTGNNGNVKFIELDNTGGMSSVAVLDLDGDGVADRVYGGDQEGNLWVVEESNNGTWDSPHKQGQTAEPLFTATDSSGDSQPITAAPRVTIHPTMSDAGNEPNLLVVFGTGSYLYENDPGDDQVQSVYAIWDKGVQVGGDRESSLVERTMQTTIVDGADARLSEGDDIDYEQKRGWYVDLPDSFERVITGAEIIGDFIFVNSMIPDVNPCVPGGTGWLMAFGLDGQTPEKRAFLEYSESIVGYKVPGIPSDSGFIYLDGQLYKTTALSDGGVDVSEINYRLDDDSSLGRQGWREIFE